MTLMTQADRQIKETAQISFVDIEAKILNKTFIHSELAIFRKGTAS